MFVIIEIEVMKMNRRELIIEAIEFLTIKHGYAPSIKEIGEYVGLKSTSTVKHHLDRLKKEGRIDFEENMNRTVRISS
jgi:repressor LexA